MDWENYNDKEAADAYWAERRERESRQAARRVWLEGWLHRLGAFLVWAASLMVAYDVGRGNSLPASVAVINWLSIALIVATIGLGLMATNKRFKD